MNGRSEQEGHQTIYWLGDIHSTQKSSCRAEHSGYHFIYINLRTILAHDNHEVINVINSNNVSVWEYKTLLLSGYFHTH